MKHTEEKRTEKLKNEESISEVQENYKQPNIFVIGVLKREGVIEKKFEEIKGKNFINLMKNINPEIQETISMNTRLRT